MDNFKRNNQVSEADIKIFKEQEINKILIKAESMKPRKFNFNLKTVMTFSVIVIALVSLSFMLFRNNDDELKNFNLQTLSNNSYILEADNEEFNLKFYYYANVVKEGERTSYDNFYDYYAPYEYVSQDIIDQFDVEFNAFEFEGNRFFLEVIVNGVSSYLQVNFATDYDASWELTDLEFDNFKEDIEEIFDWIEMYPPVLIGNSGFKPLYEINPEVADLENSKAKRNYTTFITNFYIPNNPEYEENPKDYLTLSANHVIMVDEFGDFTESHFDFAYGLGIVDPTQFESMFSDLNAFFAFYEKDSTRPLMFGGYGMFNLSDVECDGQVRDIGYGDPLNDPENFYKDMYLMFESIEGIEDLSIIDNLTISIDFTDDYGGEVVDFEVEAFYYNRAIFTGPFTFTNQENMTGDPMYNTITVTLRTETNEVIDVITFDLSSMFPTE